MKYFYFVALLILFVSCSNETGICEEINCSNHGKCFEVDGKAKCDCDSGYMLDGDISCVENNSCEPSCESWEVCLGEHCSLRNGFCKDANDCQGEQTCDANHQCVGFIVDPCKNVDCGNGKCEIEQSGYAAAARCECNEGFHAENLTCVKDPDTCKKDSDCDNQVCNQVTKYCIDDPCLGIDCGEGGICSHYGNEASCNCYAHYTPKNNSCEAITNKLNWCGINWFGGPTGSDTPNPINIAVGYTGDSAKVYSQIYQPGLTDTSNSVLSNIKAQIGYTKGNILYPINYNQLTWVDANFNVKKGNNHEYMADFPSDEAGEFKFIARFSIDSGSTWEYCDAVPSPNKIISHDISFGHATVSDTSKETIMLEYNKDLNIENKSYSFSVKYIGENDIDFDNSKFYLNGKKINLLDNYDTGSKTFTISANNLENGKYSYLFRVVDSEGESGKSLFIPIWIEDTKFYWKDAFLYQIMTDRFNNADSSNDAPVIGVDPDKNWQGGDFKGIIEKINSGYFENMGINILWISSPILNTDGKGVGVSDGKWYSAYHSYWPIATGWTHNEHLEGINSPVDPHFGTEEELKELIRLAHKKGIRVLADFVANHVFSITNGSTASGSVSPWGNQAAFFHGLNNPYVCGWEKPIVCWFTDYLPDFNYSNPILMNKVMNHAMWMIKEYDFDGFRLDAVKHMIMDFTTTIRTRIKEEIETTGYDFYTVGETFDGNADFLNSFVGDDKLFGQFEFGFYFNIRDSILKNGDLSNLKNFTNNNDTFYTDKWEGALMSNFIGNHDVVRAYSYKKDYFLLQAAHLVLMTSPRMPLIYQGDEFGMDGGADPDNRRFMRFNTELSSNEKDTLSKLSKLGKFRKEHSALRRGKRNNCKVEHDFWAYKMSDTKESIVVVINKGNSSKNFSCSGLSGTYKDLFTGQEYNISNLSVNSKTNMLLYKE